MASNEIRINQSTIDVNPLGVSKVLGFKGRFSIPFTHIKSISRDYGILNNGGGWRVAGTSFLGNNSGLYSKAGEKAYINIKRHEEPVLIELIDEDVDQLILGVENPQEFIEELKKKQPQIKSDISKGKSGSFKMTSKADKVVYYMSNSAILLAIPVVILGIISGAVPSLANITIPLVLILGIVLVMLIVASLIISVINRNQK